MIQKYLSDLGVGLAPAIADHLWQSTLFAMAVALLTFLFRNNHARTRYGLWLAASLKFMIPFSLLVSLGSRLRWIPSLKATSGLEASNASVYSAISHFGQPFLQQTPPVGSSTLSSNFVHFLPALLAGVWICGFLAVLASWYSRWRRVSAAVRNAEPLCGGRELEALRRIERTSRIRKRIEVVTSPSSLEPGVFGIARPVLVWPEGISEQLDDAHLDALLAHEVCHVRRHDNLAGAVHMVVEAAFWFYPLVWWLGTRLLEERERACDEGVLDLGSERHVYAESIVKACEFCVGSRLACVSGVTGADLRKRIAAIVTGPVACKLNLRKKFLLAGTAAAAIAAPMIVGFVGVMPLRAASRAETSPTTAQQKVLMATSSIQTETTSHPVSKPVSRTTAKCTKSLRAASSLLPVARKGSVR